MIVGCVSPQLKAQYRCYLSVLKDIQLHHYKEIFCSQRQCSWRLKIIVLIETNKYGGGMQHGVVVGETDQLKKQSSCILFSTSSEFTVYMAGDIFFQKGTICTYC